MDEKEVLVQKIRMVMRITMAFVIVMVISIGGELVLVWFGGEALWCKNLMKLFGALALISPFGVMIPLFFRVNYQSRLLVLQKKEREKAKREREKTAPENGKES